MKMKDIREINVFRVWVNNLVEGRVQEQPTEICFCSYTDAEKGGIYLNSTRTSDKYAYYFKPETTKIYKSAQSLIDEKETTIHEKG